MRIKMSNGTWPISLVLDDGCRLTGIGDREDPSLLASAEHLGGCCLILQRPVDSCAREGKEDSRGHNHHHHSHHPQKKPSFFKKRPISTIPKYRCFYCGSKARTRGFYLVLQLQNSCGDSARGCRWTCACDHLRSPLLLLLQPFCHNLGRACLHSKYGRCDNTAAPGVRSKRPASTLRRCR